MRIALEGCDGGVKIGGQVVNNIRYADRYWQILKLNYKI